MSEYCIHGKRLLTQPTKKCCCCDWEEDVNQLTEQLNQAREVIEFYESFGDSKSKAARLIIQDGGRKAREYLKQFGDKS